MVFVVAALVLMSMVDVSVAHDHVKACDQACAKGILAANECCHKQGYEYLSSCRGRAICHR